MGVTEGWGGTAAGLVQSLHVDEEPAAMAWRVAQQGAERAERAERAAELERQAEAEDQREARALRFSQMGITPHSLSDVFASASRAGDEDAELEAARATVRRIEKRQAQRTLAAERQAGKLAELERASSADPLQQAAQRAHQAFREYTRGQLARAETAPRRARPFSAGVVRRSETCIHCINQGASDEESYLLHSDPQLGLPVVPPEPAEQAVAAERRLPRRRGYAEISR